MPENNAEVEKLLQQLKSTKDDVATIKKKLAKIGKEKEQWFAKKKEISDQIRDKISSVKESKSERNTFTEEAKKAKDERDKLNKQITDGIKEIKDMKKAYKDAATKSGIKGNPAELKKSVEKLEYRLQTEPMKFDREQKIMKEIKAFKKQLAEFKDVQSEWEAVSVKSKEIDQLKKKANEYHRVVQNSAKSSQVQHETLLTDSKEIDDLKKAEEDAYNKFFECKTQFKEVNTDLKGKLKELQSVKESLEENNVAVKEEEKKNDMKSLKAKAAEVEEKISKKKKLTTEDLLIMQRSANK